jgi:hypothetical protein
MFRKLTKDSARQNTAALSIISIFALGLTGCSDNQGTNETTTSTVVVAASTTAVPQPLFSADSILLAVCDEPPQQDGNYWVCGVDDDPYKSKLNLIVFETEEAFLRAKMGIIKNFSEAEPETRAYLEARTFCGQGWILKAFGGRENGLADKTYKRLSEAKIFATKC